MDDDRSQTLMERAVTTVLIVTVLGFVVGWASSKLAVWFTA